MLGFVFLFFVAIIATLYQYADEILEWCDKKLEGYPRSKKDKTLDCKVKNALIHMRNNAGLTSEEVIKKMGNMGEEIRSFEEEGGELSIFALNEYANVCGFKVNFSFTPISKSRD